MATTEEGQVVSSSDRPMVTTISTVAIQAGDARIVLAVLHVSSLGDDDAIVSITMVI